MKKIFLNPWKLYDDILSLLPDDTGEQVDFIHIGETWTVVSTGRHTGIAVTVNEQNQPLAALQEKADHLLGQPLEAVAQLTKSWDFSLASVGTAALNAYVNTPARLEKEKKTGRIRFLPTDNGFDRYRDIAAGCKVAVIGHFRRLEEYLTESQVYVLERRPQPGDYPDSACEYLLPEMDYVFITGSTFINKTMPRLLQLAARPIFVGPSTPMTSALFEHGALELHGFCADGRARTGAAALADGNTSLSSFGTKMSLCRSHSNL